MAPKTIQKRRNQAADVGGRGHKGLQPTGKPRGRPRRVEDQQREIPAPKKRRQSAVSKNGAMQGSTSAGGDRLQRSTSPSMRTGSAFSVPEAAAGTKTINAPPGQVEAFADASGLLNSDDPVLLSINASPSIIWENGNDGNLPHAAGMPSITTPLGQHVPGPIKQKIINGEFVELASLLPDSGLEGEATAGFTVSSAGTISMTPPRIKHITSIEQWTDAFVTFMAILGTRHPNRAPELLKYMTIIRDAARKFPGMGWREYDIQF